MYMPPITSTHTFVMSYRAAMLLFSIIESAWVSHRGVLQSSRNSQKPGDGPDDKRLLMLLQRRRGSKADPITEDDVMRAIDKLKVLGGGFSVMKVGRL